jgi:hypothetical protein
MWTVSGGGGPVYPINSLSLVLRPQSLRDNEDDCGRNLLHFAWEMIPNLEKL